MSLNCIFCSTELMDDARFCYSCGQSTSSSGARGDDDDLIPTTFPPIRVGDILDNRYTITHVLGRGGMGTVYRARRSIGGSVALKALHPEYARIQSMVLRFRREARTAAKIDHENVVRIYEDNTDRGAGVLPYLVMEFLNGPTLRDILKGLVGKVPPGRLELWKAVWLMKEISAGVSAAHCFTEEDGPLNPVVHRDLKPENVMVVPPRKPGGTEIVKVVDFGIAKVREFDQTEGGLISTDLHARMGSLPYMSPEQCEDQEADTRSDVYSLGVMFYEMLAGRRPFIAKSDVGYINKHTKEAPPPLPEGVVVPPEILGVALHALAKDPDHRPGDAREFLDELQSAEEAARARLKEEERRAIKLEAEKEAAAEKFKYAVKADAHRKQREKEIAAKRVELEALFASLQRQLEDEAGGIAAALQQQIGGDSADAALIRQSERKDAAAKVALGSQLEKRSAAAEAAAKKRLDPTVASAALQRTLAVDAASAASSLKKELEGEAASTAASFQKKLEDEADSAAKNLKRRLDQNATAAADSLQVQFGDEATAAALLAQLEKRANTASAALKRQLRKKAATAAADLKTQLAAAASNASAALRKQLEAAVAPAASDLQEQLEKGEQKRREQEAAAAAEARKRDEAAKAEARNRAEAAAAEARKREAAAAEARRREEAAKAAAAATAAAKKKLEEEARAEGIAERRKRALHLLKVVGAITGILFLAASVIGTAGWFLFKTPQSDTNANASNSPMPTPTPPKTKPTPEPVPATLVGHTGQVNSIAISPDGRLLASGGRDGSVRLWDIKSGKERFPNLFKYTNAATSVAFSPNGKLLATSGLDGAVVLWDTEKGSQVFLLKRASILPGEKVSRDSVFAVAFSPDGNTLAGGSTNGRVYVWDVGTGGQKVIQDDEEDFNVFNVIFSPPSGKTLVGTKQPHKGGSNFGVILWWSSTRQPRSMALSSYLNYDVASLLFSPDGDTLYIGINDKVVLWDMAGDKCVCWWVSGNEKNVTALALSPDGNRIVSGRTDGTVEMWDRSDIPANKSCDMPVNEIRQQPRKLAWGTPERVLTLAFTRDGKFVAGGLEGGAIRFWSVDDFKREEPRRAERYK